MGLVKFLHRALQKPFVLRSVQAFILTNSLLALVLILTEQLRWLPTPWPAAVQRLFFGLLFVMSFVCSAVLGFGSAFQVYYLRRSSAAREKLDAMTILRRIVVTPATCLLSALWGWAWLSGHSPRRYGAALVGLFVAHQIVLTAHYTTKGFRQARAARLAGAESEAVTAVPSGPRNVTRRSRTLHGRISNKLRRLAWEIWWKAFYRRRLSPLDRSLCQSVFSGNVNNVEVFLRRGANANPRLLYNSSLLVISAGDGRTEIVRLLLDAGAGINNAGPLTGATALAYAAMRGHMAVVRLLLDRGAAVDARTNSGATPLILAANGRWADCVRLLLDAHADVNAATRRGMTALMFAALRGSEETTRALLDAGADTEARSRSGRTALRWAEKGRHGAVAMLLQQGQETVAKAKD